LRFPEYVVEWPALTGGTSLSHVLVGGDEQQVSELRFLLAKWGMTVGALEFADTCPTILACDAVILQGNCDGYRDTRQGTLPDGPGGAAGPAAPLIFINGDGVPRDDLPAAWIVLNHIDPDGQNLRLALQMAQARAGAWRDQISDSTRTSPVAAPVQTADSYGHFLGHELRSPLTAIKTALETLAAEVDTPDVAGRLDVVDAKLVTIALRNVQRLQQTVDWSQDLLAANESATMPRWREVSVSELAVCLQRHGEVVVAADLAEYELLTDPDLFETLTDQMVRAVVMTGAADGVTLCLTVDPGEVPRLQLSITGSRTVSGPASPLGQRTRLVRAETAADPGDDLARLSRFLVSPPLIRALEATLTATVSDEGRPQLELSLAGQPATAPSF
jgi:hypothetical protein